VPLSDFSSLSDEGRAQNNLASEVLSMELDFQTYQALFTQATILRHTRSKWGCAQKDGATAPASIAASLPQLEVLNKLKGALRSLPKPKKKDKAVIAL